MIINILGSGGEALDAGSIAGAAGNGSLMAFTRALGGQSANVGVRVIGVNPVRSPPSPHRPDADRGEKAPRRCVALARAGERLSFRPRRHWRGDCSHGALLASDLSSYTSGTIVTIDRGMVNRGSLI